MAPAGRDLAATSPGAGVCEAQEEASVTESQYSLDRERLNRMIDRLCQPTTPKPASPAEDASFLRAEYQVAVEIIKLLTDIRFRCLVFVTAITAASSALVSSQANAEIKPALGILGLLATLGIAIYELRNSQLYEVAMARAKALERALHAPRTGTLERKEADEGGIFAERPGYIPAGVDESSPHFMRFWFVGVQHDRGLGLIYSSAIGAWFYLALSGLLSMDAPVWAAWTLSVGGIRAIAGAGASLAIAISYFQFIAHDRRRRKIPRLRSQVQEFNDNTKGPFLWCCVRPRE